MKAKAVGAVIKYGVHRCQIADSESLTESTTTGLMAGVLYWMEKT
jgi:hypothetical protein